jgi:hypothetical protein
MHLSVQEINTQLLMLSEQEQLKVFYLLKNRLQSFISKEEQRDFAVFSGILKSSPNFNGDPVEIQRSMRDEWS